MSNLRDCFVPCVLDLLRKDYDTFLLPIETNTVAIISDNIGRITIFFKFHSREIHGNAVFNGAAILLELI